MHIQLLLWCSITNLSIQWADGHWQNRSVKWSGKPWKKYSPAQARRILKRNVKFIRQHSKKDVTKALVLRTMSNKAYGFIWCNHLMAMPNQPTLLRWLRILRQDIVSAMLIVVHILFIFSACRVSSEIAWNHLREASQSTSPHEKLVTISFDQVELRKKYEYHSTTKRVYGPCKKLQVAIIPAVTLPWKQLVFFDFDVAMPRELFSSIVHLVTTEFGADVCAVALDLGNKTFLLQFNLTEDRHTTVLLHNDTTSDIDGEQKIFVFPDTPHMLKLSKLSLPEETLLDTVAAVFRAFTSLHVPPAASTLPSLPLMRLK